MNGAPVIEHAQQIEIHPDPRHQPPISSPVSCTNIAIISATANRPMVIAILTDKISSAPANRSGCHLSAAGRFVLPISPTQPKSDILIFMCPRFSGCSAIWLYSG